MPQISVGTKMAGDLDSTHDCVVDAKRKYQFYLQHWMSSGFQLGDVDGKQPEIPGAPITGRFLAGVWGSVKPTSHHTLNYGLEISLLVGEEALTVVPSSYGLRDIFNFSNRSRSREFESLKSAVATWLLLEELKTKGRPKGFDSNRNLLVIAHGRIDVASPSLQRQSSAVEVAALSQQAQTPSKKQANTKGASRGKSRK